MSAANIILYQLGGCIVELLREMEEVSSLCKIKGLSADMRLQMIGDRLSTEKIKKTREEIETILDQ